jgi:hypothetical protein
LEDRAEADSRQRAGQAPRVEASGLLDMRQLAKIYEKQNRPPRRDGDAIPELITVGIGTPPGLVLPLPPPPELDPQKQKEAQRNRLLYFMSAVAGAVALGAMALAFVVLRGGFAHSSQARVANPAQQPAPVQATQPAAQPATQPAAGSAATLEPPAAAGQPAGLAEGSASGSNSAVSKSESIKAARNPGTDNDADDAGDAGDAGDGDDDDRASSRRSRRSRDRRSKDRDRDRESREAAGAGDAAAPPPEDRCMDELACELAPNPPACCSRYKRSHSGSSEPSGADQTGSESTEQDLPRRLERSDIATGMATVQDSVAACGAGHLAKGTVTVSVKVGGDGKVARARVTSTPHEDLGSCVASRVRKASFARTQSGARFSYPFVFK